jgi:hypothetical protein
MSHCPEVAERSKRPIKNAFVCWNTFDLAQRIPEAPNADARTARLESVAIGSAIAWPDINLRGEQDVSDEEHRDSVGIGPPNHRLSALRESGSAPFAENSGFTRT